MHTYFRFKGLLLLVLVLFVYGCSGSAADPMGTGTIQFVTEYSEPYGTGTPGKAIVITTVQVDPNSSLSLTVWVSNFNSKGEVVPVIGERVTFSLDSTENGARLAVLNDRTGSNGEARVVYLAGNNLFPDVVRATTSVGATASITITKTGSTTRGSVVALTASPTAVAPLGFSAITATVTDNGKAVQGERVNFALLTGNGASLSVQTGLTNGSGQVTTTYQAGNNNIQDVVQASLGNGAKAQVVITKTGVGPGRSITLAFADSTVTSVAPGKYALIKATLKDSGTNLVSGVRVYFHLTTANGSIDRNEVITDGSGVATIVYYAWNNFEPDILQATTDDGAFAQMIITKTGQLLGYTATMAAAPPTTYTSGDVINSRLTVTVIDNNSLPAQGLRVRFNLPSVGGTFTPNSAPLTGIDGQAAVTFNFDTTGYIGTITVDAYVDLDDDGFLDPTDPTRAVTLTVN